MNNTVKKDITAEILKFPADHSLDDKTASVAANFSATTSNLHRISSNILSLSKTVVNITNNSLCPWFCSVFQLMNEKMSIARITKMELEAALTF